MLNLKVLSIKGLSAYIGKDWTKPNTDPSVGIKVLDNPALFEYPTPLENANDTEDVYVGRVRCQSIKDENWISMWIVADNVYGKGAALNTVQILQNLIENNKLCWDIFIY